MIGRLSKEEVLKGLAAEYPLLTEWDIEVERQFLAGPGRISNTFLVSCRSAQAPVTKIAAKGPPPHAENSLGLTSEWRALAMALGSGVPAPQLLFPEHCPEGFLLLEFLSGKDAETAIAAGAPPDTVFGAIGRSLRQLHSVRAPYFGVVVEGDVRSWETVISTRIEPKLESLKSILDSDLYESMTRGLAHALPALELEPDEPCLIHRDVYLSNFIVSDTTEQASILDFGMAYFGRPMYDLSKLYILDLYRYPSSRDAFIEGYLGGSQIPESFVSLLRLYLYVELMGMIRFFRAQGQDAALRHAVNVLTELTAGQGLIVDLIR